LSFAAVSKVSDEWYGDRQEKLDYFGSFLYCAASSMVLYGLSAYAEHPMVKYIFFGGVILFGIFLLEQSRASNPLLEMDLFHNTIFTMSNLAAMIHYSSTFALGFLLSLYLQLIRGFDASTAGLFLLLQPSMMALFSPKAGALSDRLQPRLVATSGMVMTAIGLAAFSFLTAVSPIWQIAVNLLFIGIGFAFFSSPNSNAIMGAVEPRQYGVAASVLSVMRLGGQAISMAIVTVLLSVYTVDAMSPEYLSSLLAAFHKIFEVLAVSCALGVAASLARGKRKI
jgi:predicted MFS family arabinose efflux permease